MPVRRKFGVFNAEQGKGFGVEGDSVEESGWRRLSAPARERSAGSWMAPSYRMGAGGSRIRRDDAFVDSSQLIFRVPLALTVQGK